jgi:hypothetical protein
MDAIRRELALAMKESRRGHIVACGEQAARDWWRDYATVGDPYDLGPHDDAYRDACDDLALRDDERDEFFPDFCAGWTAQNETLSQLEHRPMMDVDTVLDAYIEAALWSSTDNPEA